MESLDFSEKEDVFTMASFDYNYQNSYFVVVFSC